jgi:hypothetical protein
VKEMYLEELMDVVIIVKLSTTPLQMLHPVQTCVLNFGGETLLYSTALYISNEPSGSVHATDALLEKSRHKLYAAGG